MKLNRLILSRKWSEMLGNHREIPLHRSALTRFNMEWALMNASLSPEEIKRLNEMIRYTIKSDSTRAQEHMPQ